MTTKEYYEHNFPAPHIDAIESFIDYTVPTEMFTPLAEYDGSVVVERTAGEVSARCHDEEANNLALNLMHDIVQGEKVSTKPATTTPRSSWTIAVASRPPTWRSSTSLPRMAAAATLIGGSSPTAI